MTVRERLPRFRKFLFTSASLIFDIKQSFLCTSRLPSFPSLSSLLAMSLYKSFFLLISLAASASALVTPHNIGRRSAHHALVARAASPAAPALDVPVVSVPLNRSLRKRCRSRGSASNPASVPTSAVANVGAAPSVSSSHSAVTSSHKVVVAPTTHADTPTHTAITKAATSSTKTTTAAHSGSTSGNSNLPSYLIGTQTGDGTFYESKFSADLPV